MTSLSKSRPDDPIVEILRLAYRRGCEILRQREQQETEKNIDASYAQTESPKEEDNNNQHSPA